MGQLRGVELTRVQDPVASGLEEVQSPLDLLLAEGEDYLPLVSPEIAGSLMLSAPTPDPPSGFEEFRETRALSNILASLRDFFTGVEVVESPGTQVLSLPLVEVHRPEVSGCSAEFQMSYAHSRDFSFAIKVFGVGGGHSRKRKLAYGDLIKTSGNCLQLAIPVSIAWEWCRNRRGNRFWRSHVENIGLDFDLIELLGSADGCGFDPEKVKDLGILKRRVLVPADNVRQQSLTLTAGRETEFGFSGEGGALSFGPEVAVTSTKQMRFRYTLTGPKAYTPFQPVGRLTYFWSWQDY